MSVRMRCLVSEAAPAWEYRRGIIYDIPDEQATTLLALGKFEMADRKCPHCGGELGEIAYETAALPREPSQATMPRAVKRG